MRDLLADVTAALEADSRVTIGDTDTLVSTEGITCIVYFDGIDAPPSNLQRVRVDAYLTPKLEDNREQEVRGESLIVWGILYDIPGTVLQTVNRFQEKIDTSYDSSMFIGMRVIVSG